MTGRRQFLRLCGVAGIGTFAGCADSSGDSGTPTETSSTEPTKQTETLAQQAKLAAADGDSGGGFGGSVVVSDDGTTALVTAPFEADPNGTDAGAAYVFEAADESWSQQTKLSTDDGTMGDQFGGDAALSSDGTIAVIAATADSDPNEELGGSAYVFDAGGDSWSQQAELTPDEGDSGVGFGASVAVSNDGTTVLVSGAAGTSGGSGGKDAGYIFEQSDGSWSQRAKLVATDDSDQDMTSPVALSGDGTTALVGTSSNDENTSTVYVFDDAGESWRQQAKLVADDGDSGVLAGALLDVSRDGTTVLVGTRYGAPTADDSRAGSAYVFDAVDGSWSQPTALTPDSGESDGGFGWAVGLSSDGTTALVGAHLDDDVNGSAAGSAYAFESADGSWSQRAKLAPDDGDSGDRFGNAVGVSSDGTTGLVGAPIDSDPNGEGAGSAYVFEL